MDILNLDSGAVKMVIDAAVGELLSIVVGALLAAILGFVLRYVPSWARAFRDFLEAKAVQVRGLLTQEQLLIMDMIVQRIVQAVEQNPALQDIAHQGKLKKAEALRLIQIEFDRYGIEFDVVQAGNLIEAAINQGWEQPPAVMAISEVDFPEVTPAPVPPTPTSVGIN